MKYKDWSDYLVNNLYYERPAQQLEQNKQYPASLELGFPYPDATYQTLLDVRKDSHKYWRASCTNCGTVYIVRSDKIKGKWCQRCRHIQSPQQREQSQEQQRNQLQEQSQENRK